MRPYVRPAIDAPVFRDEEGQVIDYGRRWQGTSPADAYSAVSHPERYAPLHAVADALIAYLRGTFDVEVDEGLHVAEDLLRPRAEAKRAVRVRPAGVTSASLTFVFTAFPGVILHAGLLHDFPFPVCACDACDSSWDQEAVELERAALAVVTGSYQESIAEDPDRRIGFSLTFANGSASGWTRADDHLADRVAAAGPVLRDLSDGWAAWPLRAQDGPGFTP